MENLFIATETSLGVNMATLVLFPPFFVSVHVYTVIMERQGEQGCALVRDFELFLILCQWKQ